MEKNLSIIIPIWNESESIEYLFRELFDILQEYRYEWEIIAVDDGSADETYSLLRKCEKVYPNIRVLKMNMHCGKSAALFWGFKFAKYNLIALMDSDLQNNPVDILRMADLLGENNVVLGYRKKRYDNMFRIIYSKIANSIRRFVLSDNIIDAGCPVKLFEKNKIDVFIPFDGAHRFFGTMFCYAKVNILQIEIDHRERRFGKSKYKNFQRLKVTLLDLLLMYLIKRRYIVNLSLLVLYGLIYSCRI